MAVAVGTDALGLYGYGLELQRPANLICLPFFVKSFRVLSAVTVLVPARFHFSNHYSASGAESSKILTARILEHEN
jgi:hypothetical protein